ncbi:MAG TPA: SDR family NAD(P)-dependent oxidoreductase, partial [Gemmatimonadales bacterium]|nr:SDR family NAD(P)-dependent oxidoreductase [Gemmatimonadales bacterium]
RNAARLGSVADDLRVRGAAGVHTAVLDVAQVPQQAQVIDSAISTLGGLDVALIAHGILPVQSACEKDVGDTVEALHINFTATVALLTVLANYFEAQRSGCIAVITSVAGDRGRRSNYVYGAAKGGVDRFLQGLRNRLHASGVTVVTIKPGFVDTPMTAAVKKSPLFASARRVGRGIYRAIEQRRDVVYIPWFWRPLMLVIRGLPERLFKRLHL